MQFAVPGMERFIRGVTLPLRYVTWKIRFGQGRGLRFNPHGSNLGYGLGTSNNVEQQALAELLRPGDVFYDIGAHVGFYAVLGAHLVGSTGHVIAFEPFPQSAAAIRYNAALNGFDQITVIEKAVATANADVVLSTDRRPLFHRLMTRARAAKEHRKVLDVPVVSIDALISETRAPAPDTVLIDVEGAELLVLEGMQDTLRTCRPSLLCELHWTNQRFATTVAPFLHRLGYTIVALDGQPWHTPKRYMHVLCRPTR